MKKRRIRLIGKKEIIISVLSIILATAGIKASDTLFSKEKTKDALALCPDDMVFVPTSSGGYCIDKYEESASDGCPSANPQSQNDTSDNLLQSDCKPQSVADKTPWINISQTQAQEACAKAGKRLPTGEEWYFGALGTPDKENGWNEDDCQVSKNWPDQPGMTGSGKSCISGVGAYDMIGNVWEWTSEEITDGKLNGQKLPASGYVKEIDSKGNVAMVDENNPSPNFNNDYFWIKNSGLRAMARGGYWDNKDQAGKFSVYLVLPPSYAGNAIGFRCVK